MQIFRIRKIGKLGKIRFDVLCDAYEVDKKHQLPDGRKIDLKEFAGFGVKFGADGDESSPGFICDYLIPFDDAMCVVEHSQLVRQMKDLSRQQEPKCMRESIKREFRLKAYGSMLVLHRLFLIHYPVVNEETAREFSNMPCKFWVVATDAQADEQIAALQFLSDSLKDGLAGLYSGAEVLTVDMFKKKLRTLPRS